MIVGNEIQPYKPNILSLTFDQAIKEKERSRDLVSASTYCEAMAVELTAIASNVSSARKLLKALDNHGTPFLDVLIDMEQKEVRFKGRFSTILYLFI